MRKTIGFRIRHHGDKESTYSVEGEEISTSGSLISVVKTIEADEDSINPLPEKFVVRMFSVHNLDWIDPIYEEEEVEDE